MWAACSPGGRPLRFSPIVNPEPPSASLIVAVPTLLPFASFSSTVMGVAAYAIAATMIRPIRKARSIIFLFPPQRIFAVNSRTVGHAVTVSAFRGEKGEGGRLRRHSLVHP